MDFFTKDICLEGRGVLVKSKTRKTWSVGAVDGFIVFNTRFHFTTKKNVIYMLCLKLLPWKSDLCLNCKLFPQERIFVTLGAHFKKKITENVLLQVDFKR